MTMQKPGEAAGLPRGKWLKLMYSIAQRGFADPVNQDLVTLNLQEMDAFANACFAAGAADVLAYSMEIHKQRDDLLAALELADLSLSGVNMNMRAVEAKVKAAIAAARGGA